MTQHPSHFWEWFQQHNLEYLILNRVGVDTKEQMLGVLMEQLHKYCDSLYFEIGGNLEGRQELIITAEGNTAYFDKVETLIEAAPSIKNWDFIAFIPPRKIDFKMEYEDVELKPNELWFEPLEHPDRPSAIGIKICLSNFEMVKDREWLQPAIYKVLDYILGEKSFALDIEHVAIGHLPGEPAEKGMIKLTELPAFVRWKKGS